MVNHESKSSGFLHTFRNNTPQVVKDNAPRVVAGLKMIASGIMLASPNKGMKLGGMFNMLGHTTIVLFGHKKTEQEKEGLRDADGLEESGNPIVANIGKIIQPHKYPIESGTALFTIGDAFWAASGFTDEGKKVSYPHLLGGAWNLASDVNLIVTGEDIKGFTNPHAKGTVPYYVSELQHKPVLTSSLMNMLGDSSSLIGGAYDHFVNGGTKHTMVLGGLLITANTLQALLVHKNDYNIEEDPSLAKNKEQTPSPDTKINAPSLEAPSTLQESHLQVAT